MTVFWYYTYTTIVPGGVTPYICSYVTREFNKFSWKSYAE